MGAVAERIGVIGLYGMLACIFVIDVFPPGREDGIVVAVEIVVSEVQEVLAEIEHIRKYDAVRGHVVESDAVRCVGRCTLVQDTAASHIGIIAPPFGSRGIVHGAGAGELLDVSVDVVEASAHREKVTSRRFPAHVESGLFVTEAEFLFHFAFQKSVGFGVQICGGSFVDVLVRHDTIHRTGSVEAYHHLIGLDGAVSAEIGLLRAVSGRQGAGVAVAALLSLCNQVQDSSESLGIIFGARFGQHLDLLDRFGGHRLEYLLVIGFHHHVFLAVDVNLEAGIAVDLYVVLGIDSNHRHLLQGVEQSLAFGRLVFAYIVGQLGAVGLYHLFLCRYHEIVEVDGNFRFRNRVRRLLCQGSEGACRHQQCR